MPQLKIRGIEKEKIVSVSTTLVNELSELVSCSREDFTIELIESTYIFDGQEVNPYPFIEVAWFDRGQEVQDKVAEIITNKFRDQGIQDIDLMFILLEENKYYYNGKHF